MNSIWKFIRLYNIQVILYVTIVTILSTQLVRSQNGIIIENVRPTFPKEGESFTIKGRVDPAGNLSQLYVDDPVSGLCTKVQLENDGSFSYTTQPALKAGLFGLVFKTGDIDALLEPEIYVISIAPDFKQNRDQYFYYVDGIEISLGAQGSSLDEETNSMVQRVDGGLLDKISWLDDADVLKDGINATSQLGVNIIENISRSPSTLIVLGVTGVACIGTGGVTCTIVIPIAIRAIAKASISESVNMMVNHSPNLKDENRQLIMEATRIALRASDIYTILSGANALGEFKSLEESINFWSSVTSLAEDEIMSSEIEEIETNDDGSLSSITLQLVLKSGDIYIQKLVTSERTEINDNTYLDTRIRFKDGHELLCTAVHGDFGGHQIGAILNQPTSFLTVIDPQGDQQTIPKNQVIDVQEEPLQVLEVDPILGLQVRLNRGSRHQIKVSASYRVYRLSKNMILGNSEVIWLGRITILNVMEDASTAMIAYVKRGARFKRGDYCRP